MSKALKKAETEGAAEINGASRIILKVLAVIGITAVCVAVAFLLLCIFGVKSNMNLGGYSLHLMNDASSAVLPNGSLYISKSAERGRSYIENDAIIFTDENNIETPGRILRIETADTASSEEGEQKEQDERDVPLQYVVMTAQGETIIDEVQLWATIEVYIPYIGYVIDFVVTPLGLVCCVATPLFILLIVEIINLIKLPKSLKSEDEEENESLDKKRGSGKKADSLRAKPFDSQILPLSDEPIFVAEASMKQDTVSSVLLKKAEEQEGMAPLNILSAESSSLIEDIGDEELTAVERNEAHSVSYEKPREVVKPDENDLQLTREYSIVLSAPKDDGKEKKKSLFSADLREESPNHFKIEGIDVNVEADSIKLSVDELLGGRDIAITVAKDYTNVIVGTEESQIDFALFRDEADDEQKVIIRKKTK